MTTNTNSAQERTASIDLDKLQPCPFCGGPARIESSAMWLDLICDHDKTCCLDGDSAEMSYQNASGARDAMVAKWNRRSLTSGAPAEPCNYVEDFDRNERRESCTVCGDTRYGSKQTKCGSAIAHLRKVGLAGPAHDAAAPSNTRALCMLIAEAAHRNATGGKAMPADQIRAIVDDVLAGAAAKTEQAERKVQTITVFFDDEITFDRSSGFDEQRIVWNPEKQQTIQPEESNLWELLEEITDAADVFLKGGCSRLGPLIEKSRASLADLATAAGAGSTQGEWQIVPVKLTKEMQRIAVKARGNRNTPVEEIWSQILSAAPRAAIAPSRDAGQEEASTQTVPDGAAGTVEKDAARYRWLRNGANFYGHQILKHYGDEALDRKIDVAIEAHNKAGKEQG